VDAENPVTSCDLHVLVKAAEPVSSQRPKSCAGARGSAACRRLLIERSVWAVGVVVLDELLPDLLEVAESGNAV
jgi:hypothetical protein